MTGLYQQLQEGPFVMAGPCVIESEALVMEVADFLLQQQKAYPQWTFVFKASFDKANRTSLHSFRGPGMEKGLAILERVHQQTGLPILTDIHEPHQAEPAGQVAAILQIPAFLVRQTDLLIAAARYGNVVNLKKAQFMAGSDMQHPAKKVRESGNHQILLTERGTAFGYHDLVVDYRNLVKLRELGYPVVLDATHAVQQPGGGAGQSGGQREYVKPLTMAARGMGVHGFFFEVHPDPDNGLSDAANMVDFSRFQSIISNIAHISTV